MTGTEKQVAWAEDLKRKFFRTNDIYVEMYGKEFFEAVVEYINTTKTDAVFWIDSMKEDQNQLFCNMIDEFADYLEANDKETFNKYFA